MRPSASLKRLVSFFGSDHFSCRTFEHLWRARNELGVSLHCVGPPAHLPRGNIEPVATPLEQLAQARELQYESVRASDLPSWKPPYERQVDDVLVTASYGGMIPRGLLDRYAEHHCLNVHPSLLPVWRGSAPIERAIATGKLDTGVTVQTLSPDAFDRGLILASEAHTLEDGAMYAVARDQLANIGGDLLVRVLQQLFAGKLTSREQDNHKATIARKLRHQDSRIDFASHSASQIMQHHRAFSHRHPIWTTYLDRNLVLLKLDVDANGHVGSPGSARWDDGRQSVRIETIQGDLLVSELQLTGGKPQGARSWWRGHAISRGHKSLIFGT
ncbi:uncharacterized protein L969DRAFT_88238 [Mixia osmundae IAM 14324]|nr:uncharacterized protein L969DRAFT_88238 [Mixia osmundae IAM 14324]KEI38884.1 hypothetical protein L969DRAFT_88238 [Mixia osmundae IAM 14324]